jgi:hypothetical protein
MRHAMRWWVPLALAAGLAGCGQSPDDLAVGACKAAVTERLVGKTWSVDDDEWKAGYKAGDPGLAEIVAPVYFDKGLPTETTQTITCRVQFDANDAAAPPSVIGLVFQW